MTNDERRFYTHRAHAVDIAQPHAKRPHAGRLYMDGTVILSGDFKLLQYKRSQMIAQGFAASRFKISY